MQPECPQGVH